MIHLTEALMSSKTRSQKEYKIKTFGELTPGDTIYFCYVARNDGGEFILDSIEAYKEKIKGRTKHKIRLGVGKDYSYAPYEYRLFFGDGWIWYVPGNVSYMELPNDDDSPVMMVTTSEKDYEQFKKFYGLK